MKVRFYCDLPEPAFPGLWIAAHSSVPSGDVSTGYRRFTFEVDFPVRMTSDAEPVEAGPVEEVR